MPPDALRKSAPPSATGFPLVLELTVTGQGGPPFVHPPLIAGSGALSGFVNASLAVAPGHAAPTPPAGAVIDRCARKLLRPEKVCFETMKSFAGDAGNPGPVGPAKTTALFASSSSHLYVSAATCALEISVGSVDARARLLNVTLLASEVTSIPAANGRTEYLKSKPLP